VHTLKTVGQIGGGGVRTSFQMNSTVRSRPSTLAMVAASEGSTLIEMPRSYIFSDHWSQARCSPFLSDFDLPDAMLKVASPRSRSPSSCSRWTSPSSQRTK
jgi:hypothetical protein